MKGKVIIISAPSGAGKTTIVKHLLASGLNLMFSVSACSRQKRPNEVHGVDYYFISEDEFKQKIDLNEFLEWEEVYTGQYYGTLKSEVEKALNRGKNILIEADIAGGLKIKQFYNGNALAIFIQPPSELALEERLRARGTETPHNIAKRLAKAKVELKYANSFDKVVVNEDISNAVNDTINIVSGFLEQN